MPADDVGAFFDEQAETYHRPGPMAPFHRETARRIEAGVAGRVLCIGGPWAQADLAHRDDVELTFLDLSPTMLEHWAELGGELVTGDARSMPFDDDSFDHIVCSLVLHHITENGFRSSRRQLDAVFDEVARVLRPGGTAWITDFSVSPVIYGLEAAASPVTKRALGLAGIPLVIMHPASTYAGHLRRRHFGSVETWFPDPSGVSRLDLLQPVIGLPWLRVPRGAYPLRPVLVSGSRHA